ncbi:hypothetical protein PR202_ga09950 [Eleusine coracana subsp. coracana]|uniref:Jacalin-type lectin domain-containing protein n=1 Tax=Eleusine coracana subsp. coracana TaxID=191504 RepID=A0AAV5C4Y6_ELECO|nr:hypothetical protein PR202_ga09950 [Eleusine coracana subsp. coracana]
MVASSKVIRVGPWGGRGGSPWDDGAHRGVRSITVAYGRSLESMTVEYVDRNGRPVHGEKHGGGTSRSRTEKVRTCHVQSEWRACVCHYHLRIINGDAMERTADRGGVPVRVRDGRERQLPRGARRVAARGAVTDLHDEPGEGARAVWVRRPGHAVRVPDGRGRRGRLHGPEQLARRRAGPLRRRAQARDHLRRGPGARAHRVPDLRLRRQRHHQTTKRPFEWCYK